MSKMLEREQRLDSLRRERTYKPAAAASTGSAPAVEPIPSESAQPPSPPTPLATTSAPAAAAIPSLPNRPRRRWRLLLSLACSVLLLGSLAWWGRRRAPLPKLANQDEALSSVLAAAWPSGGLMAFDVIKPTEESAPESAALEDVAAYAEVPLPMPQPHPTPPLAVAAVADPQAEVVDLPSPAPAVNPEVREAIRVLQLMETALSDVTRRALFVDGQEPPEASQR
ncbi:MAG: hypothetical protein HY598_05335 [Candidatus Omnitrophica bacterium]|nr:hypothetical protein [Candidatus Omnitrophota bacterium]